MLCGRGDRHGGLQAAFCLRVGLSELQVKFPYWGVLNYVDSLCIKISPIFYIANANPNPAEPSTPQYGNYPELQSFFIKGMASCTEQIVNKSL